MAEDTQQTASASLVLRVAEETGRLQALYAPAQGRRLEGPADLRARVEAAGYGDWYLFEAALKEFVAAVNDTDAPVVKEIAERRDAEVQVQVGRDAAEATLTLTRCYGGEPASRERVKAALAEAEITHGVDWAAVDAALAEGEVEGRVIARGEPAEPGRDARFVCLLKSSGGRAPKIDQHGVADYRDLDTFLTVEPGDMLMRRIPATPGRAGRTVRGQVIPPKAGKDTGYSGGLKGARIDPDDANLLLAEIGGLPTVFPQGVRVDPVIVVEQIDLSTGNLDFDGVVQVRGDVATGARVTATGDVFVGGTVEGAEIRTPCNVEVRGSIVGQGNVRGEDGKLSHSAARIHAGGSVKARVITNAAVEAGSVLVGNEIAHSEITARQEVTVGSRGSEKAQIVGGEIRATRRIQAALLGSGAGVHTVLVVGHDPATLRASEQLQARMEQKQGQRNELAKALEHLTRQGAGAKGRLEKVRNTLQQMMQELRQMEQEQAALKARLAVAADACIVATRRLHANVELTIGGHAQRIRDEHAGGVFVLQDGKIVVK